VLKNCPNDLLVNLFAGLFGNSVHTNFNNFFTFILTPIEENPIFAHRKKILLLFLINQRKNMKKLVLLAFAAFGLAIGGTNAQSTITFEVDADDFINNGGILVNGSVSIAGNFTARTGDISDWTPADGAMEDLGDNVFIREVSFSAPSQTDSLNWKYVSGASWGDGDEGDDWAGVSTPGPGPRTCTSPDNNNRKTIVPASGDWLYASKWAECGALITSNLQLLSGLEVKMGPNPTSSTLNIRFAGSANSVIKMTSVDGRVVKTIKTSVAGDSQNAVDVSDLKGGVYYVTVVDNKKGFQAPVVIVR